MLRISSSYTNVYRKVVPYLILAMCIVFLVMVFINADIVMAAVAAAFVVIQLVILFVYQPITKLQVVYFDKEEKQFKTGKGNGEPVVRNLYELEKIKYRNKKVYCCLMFRDNQKVWFLVSFHSESPSRNTVLELLDDLNRRHLFQY